MSVLSRIVFAATAGVVLVGLASCGGGAPGSTTPSARPGAGLVNLDPCKVMTSQQLIDAGVSAQGKQVSQIPSEPGCSFESAKLIITFYKNQTETVDSYEKDGSWSQYSKTTVNGREAARAIAAGSQGTGICQTLINAGGGVVMASVTDPESPDNQVCDESAKYAQEVEPNLPK